MTQSNDPRRWIDQTNHLPVAVDPQPEPLIPAPEQPSDEEMDRADAEDDLAFTALIEQMRELKDHDTILEVPNIEGVLAHIDQEFGGDDDL